MDWPQPGMVCCTDEEPVLSDADGDRFSIFPIQHAKVYEMYKKAVASFWTGA